MRDGAQTLRLVLFDLDDVLYAYDRARRIALISEATGLPADVVEARIFVDGVEDAGDAGVHATVSSYLAAWSAALDRDIPLDLWMRARARAMTPIPGSIAIMRQLATAGTTVAVLTNNGFAVKETRAALAPAVALIAGARFLVSAEFASRKPSPVVYERALGRLGFRPAETVFIDDRADNVDGARAAGITGIQFTDPERLRADLTAIGVLPEA